MAGLVVDASVSAAWCFEDEASPLTEAALDHVVRNGARVPALWLFEMSNVLAMGERRGRLDAARAAQLGEILTALPVEVDRADGRTLMPTVIRLARAQRLSAYDASYLELAIRTGLPLATYDGTLRSAAEQLGVAIFAG